MPPVPVTALLLRLLFTAALRNLPSLQFRSFRFIYLPRSDCGRVDASLIPGLRDLLTLACLLQAIVASCACTNVIEHEFDSVPLSPCYLCDFCTAIALSFGCHDRNTQCCISDLEWSPCCLRGGCPCAACKGVTWWTACLLPLAASAVGWSSRW